MDLVDNSTYLIEKVVQEVKSQGLFDQFRKECISDVDTKPAYQNLKKRVETNVQNFLDQQEWRTDSNRNQMREKLRKHIAESSFLETGVERIVDQVVNPKISTIFLPKIEEVVYQYLGIEKPLLDDRQNFTNTNFLNIKTEEVHLLPNDLEAVSPDSNKSNKSINNSTENLNESFYEMNESAEKIEEFESPAFEPLEGLGPELVVNKEESNDSHLSNISGLTSQDSVNSEKDLIETTPVVADNQMDTANNDSLLSQVSSNSRLSIITKSESTSPKMDISEDTQMSSHMNGSLQEKIDIISNFDVKIDEASENSVEMKEDTKETELDLIKEEEVIVAEPVTELKEEPIVEPEIILELKEEIKEVLSENEIIHPPAETVIEQPLKEEIKKLEEETKIEIKQETEIKIEDEIKISLEEELHTKVGEEIKPVVVEEIKIKIDEDVIIGNSSTNDSIKSDETPKDKNIKECTKSSPKTTKTSDDKSKSRYSSDKSKDRHKSSSSSSRHHSSSSNSRDDKKSYRSDDRRKDEPLRKDEKSRRDDRKRSGDRHRSKSDSKSSRDKSRSDKDKRDSSSKHSSKGSNSKNDSRSRETDRHRRSDPKDRKDKSSERPSSSNDNKSKDRLVDDHYSSRDKINEKRRSTDRDSNDGSNSGSTNFVNQETIKKTETSTTVKSNSTTSPSNSSSSTSTSSQDRTEAVSQSNVDETKMAIPMASQPIVFNSSNMGENTCLELVIGPDSKMNDFNILKKKPKTIIVPSDDEEDLHYFPEEKQMFKENLSLLNYVNKLKAEHEVYQKTAYLLDCDEVYLKNFQDVFENVIEIKGDEQIRISKVNQSEILKPNCLENANKRQRKPNNRYSTNDFHVKLDSEDDDESMPKSEILSKRKFEDDGINNNSNLIKKIKVDENQKFEKANEVHLNFKLKENLTKWVSQTPNNNEKELERKPHQNNVKANQRYSSDDLYKPRPTVGIRRRRGDTAL